MDKFEPVMRGRPDAAADRRGTGPSKRQRYGAADLAEHRPAQYLMAARPFAPAVDRGAFVGMQLNFFAFFQSSPIMAPLLMFG
jgi:hypothetical protein